MRDIVQFAAASARREAEICQLQWHDNEDDGHTGRPSSDSTRYRCVSADTVSRRRLVDGTMLLAEKDIYGAELSHGLIDFGFLE